MSLRPVLPTRHALAVTPWFHGTAAPARPGVYERRNSLAPYSYWTPDGWGLSSISPDQAYLVRDVFSVRQDVPWRGLIAEPASR